MARSERRFTVAAQQGRGRLPFRRDVRCFPAMAQQEPRTPRRTACLPLHEQGDPVTSLGSFAFPYSPDRCPCPQQGTTNHEKGGTVTQSTRRAPRPPRAWTVTRPHPLRVLGALGVLCVARPPIFLDRCPCLLRGITHHENGGSPQSHRAHRTRPCRAPIDDCAPCC